MTYEQSAVRPVTIPSIIIVSYTTRIVFILMLGVSLCVCVCMLCVCVCVCVCVWGVCMCVWCVCVCVCVHMCGNADSERRIFNRPWMKHVRIASLAKW